jgi:ectoine hydroxylase-related dioxygenase (phytanoyl-CoA dioxygenase family)
MILDADVVASFHARGHCVTPPLFDDGTLSAVRGEIERVWHERNEQSTQPGTRSPLSKEDALRVRPELQRLHLDSELLAAFCCHPRLAAVARALIGPDADLSWNQAYAKAPGGDPRTAIPWHQDAYYAEVDGPTYNCWVAITRTTIENGTIRRAPQPPALIPHAWDERLLFYRCEIDERAAVDVELAPGQAFIFTGHVPHASGVNASGETRVAYSLSFSAPSARLRANGETFGDRIPVLRGGRPIGEVMEEHALAPGGGSPGARIVAEILARAPGRAKETRALLGAYATALRAEDRAEAERILPRVLSMLPDDREVLGDRLRARARVDQLMRELSKIRGRDAPSERLLLERVLELDPGHDRARAELSRLSTGAPA